MFGFNIKKLPNFRLLYLLVAILVLLVVYPFFINNGNLSLIPLILMDLVIPFIAVYIAADHKANLFVATALAVPLVILSWLTFFDPNQILMILQYIFGIIFYAFSTYLVLHQIIKKDVITFDIIVGSIAAYLMIGLTWTSIYALIAMLVSDSFKFSVEFAQTSLDQIDFIYYSFVTLTNLGYGDIVPTSHYTRAFSIIESVAGVMFTAIVVGRVIGLYVAEKGHSIFKDVIN